MSMQVTNNAIMMGPKNNPRKPNVCNPPITPKKIAKDDNPILSPINFGLRMLSMYPSTNRQYIRSIMPCIMLP